MTTLLSTHALNCIKAFESVASASAQQALIQGSNESLALPQALAVIYHENGSLLKSLLNDGLFNSSSSPDKMEAQNSSMDMIRELILITSSLLAALSSPQKSEAWLKTPSSVLVSLAPYWAVVVFVTRIGGQNSADEKIKLMKALRTLLIDSSIMESASLLSFDAAVFSEGFARTSLSSLLHFTVQFVLAMRQSLERKVLTDSLPLKFSSAIIDLSDNNSLKLIHFILKQCPQLAVTRDFSASQALPLSYVVGCVGLLSSSANRLSGEANKSIFDRLYLQLVQLFCQLAPECLGCPDKQRRVALHYACMNVSMPSILSVILRAFPCTAALMDSQGLYPINYLLQHNRRDEQLTLELFNVYPNAVGRLPISSYVESKEKECASFPAADTDNESLSGSSHFSAPTTPLSVDCDDCSPDSAMLQYAASLLSLKSAQSSSSDSLSSRKKKLSGTEYDVDLPVGKRPRRKV